MVSAYSIGTSKRSNQQKQDSSNNPGPGQYNPNVYPKKQPPGWKIGSAIRVTDKLNDTPGPGQYEYQNLNQNKKKFPEYSFGSKTMTSSFKKMVPGPGAYEPKEYPTKTPPFYSFGLKTGGFDQSFHKTPGPGQYNPQNYNQINLRPSSKIGTAQRSKYQFEDTPGPGSYQVKRPSSSGPLYRFGTANRANDQENQNVPGPGTYNLKGTIDSKGSTIVPKRGDNQMKESEKVPGPGQYTPKVLDTTIGGKIGTETRGLLQKSDTPGPGQYNPFQQSRNQNPQYKIGTSKRSILSYTLDNPGPGTYNIPQSTTDGPKYSCVKRNDENNQKYTTPGPGQYQPLNGATNYRAPSPIIGTSRRADLKSTDVPGPGNYNINAQKYGPQWGFGRSQRGDQSKTTTNDPGPGSYNIPSMVADVPKYLLTNSKKQI